ncbi:MAG: helix-turn-helix domain-containing protein [Pseudonocardiaceae bacterium]
MTVGVGHGRPAIGSIFLRSSTRWCQPGRTGPAPRPAVASQAIRSLKRDLGTALFDRVGRRVVLTDLAGTAGRDPRAEPGTDGALCTHVHPLSHCPDPRRRHRAGGHPSRLCGARPGRQPFRDRVQLRPV